MPPLSRVRVRVHQIQRLTTARQVSSFTLPTHSRALAPTATQVPIGLLLDRVDPHWVFAVGVIIRAGSVGAIPMCQHLWQVNALAVVQGATLPMIGVSIRVCLVRVFGKHHCAAAGPYIGTHRKGTYTVRADFHSADGAERRRGRRRRQGQGRVWSRGSGRSQGYGRAV